MSRDTISKFLETSQPGDVLVMPGTGQAYTLQSSNEAFAVWSLQCAVCGDTLETTSPRDTSGLVRTCAKHRGWASNVKGFLAVCPEELKTFVEAAQRAGSEDPYEAAYWAIKAEYRLDREQAAQLQKQLRVFLPKRNGRVEKACVAALSAFRLLGDAADFAAVVQLAVAQLPEPKPGGRDTRKQVVLRALSQMGLQPPLVCLVPDLK